MFLCHANDSKLLFIWAINKPIRNSQFDMFSFLVVVEDKPLLCSSVWCHRNPTDIYLMSEVSFSSFFFILLMDQHYLLRTNVCGCVWKKRVQDIYTLMLSTLILVPLPLLKTRSHQMMVRTTDLINVLWCKGIWTQRS